MTVNNSQVVLQECKVVLSRIDPRLYITPFRLTMSVDENCCVCDSISQMNYSGLKSCTACSKFFIKLKRDKNKLKEVIREPCLLSSEENKCPEKLIKKCRTCRARKCLEVGFKCDDVSASDISIRNASGPETVNSKKRKHKSSPETVTKDPKKHKKKQVATGNLDDNLGSTSKYTLDETKKEKGVDALEGKCGKDNSLDVSDTSDYMPAHKSREAKKLSTVSDKKNNEDTVKSRVKKSSEKVKRKRIVFIESDSSLGNNSSDESKERITIERIKKKKDIDANLNDRKFKDGKTDVKSHIKSQLIKKKEKKDSNELNSLSETHLTSDEQRKRKSSVSEKKKKMTNSNLSDKKMKDNKTKEKGNGKNLSELIQKNYKHATKPNSSSGISLLTKVDTNLRKSISNGQHNVKKSEIINKKGKQSETKPSSHKDVKKLSKVISGSEHLSLSACDKVSFNKAEEVTRLESEVVGVKKLDLNKAKENKSMKKDDSKKSSKPKKKKETYLTGDKSKSSKSDQQNVKKTTSVLVIETEKNTKDTEIVIDDKVCLPANICSSQKSKTSGVLDFFSDNELDYDYNDAIDGDEEEVNVTNQDSIRFVPTINADKAFKSCSSISEDDDKSSMNSCSLNFYCESSETETEDENEEFENVPNNEICDGDSNNESEKKGDDENEEFENVPNNEICDGDSNNESEKIENVAVNMLMEKEENITALLPSVPEASSLPSDFVIPENIAEENDIDIISIFAPNIDLLQLDSYLFQGLSWKKNDSQLRCPVKKEFSNFQSKPNADASASKSNITSSRSSTSYNKPTSNFAPKTNVTKSQSSTSFTKQISNIASQSNIATRQATTSSKSLISPKPNITTSLSSSCAFNPISNVASNSDNTTSQSTSTTSSKKLISNVVTDVATIKSNSSFEENSISKIQTKDILLNFLKASRENNLVYMQNIYNKKKEIIGDDLRQTMVQKLITVCLKVKSIRQAFLYLSDIKQLKMEKSEVLLELLDYCSTLPKTEENLRNEFIQYLVSVKYPIDGGRLRRNLDEFLKKGYVTSLWKLFNYSVNLNYHPSCKLCEWAIDQLAENEDKLNLVLTVFYKSAEDEKKISQKSLNKLRKFTTKNGSLEDAKLVEFLQRRNYTLSYAKKDMWKMFCEASQFDERLMNELLLTFYEDISVVGQLFSSFFDYVKERLSRDLFFKRVITQIGFTVILECHIRKEYKSGHTVILIIFGDSRNHFELLETNDLVPVITILQMALACIDICMQVNDLKSALVLLKAGEGATPSDDFKDVEQRLLRLNLLHTLFEKLIAQNEIDNHNLIYLYECLLKTNERDCAVLKGTCASPGSGLIQVCNKLMTHFLEINNFELARIVYNKGKSHWCVMSSDCFRGYLVLMKRNEHYGAIDADELFKLYRLCQMRGIYPLVESFANSQWVVKIRSSYVYEELQVILEYYLKSLADHLKEQNEFKPVIISIEERKRETSLTVLLSSTDLTYTLDRIAKALREMNPSIYLESCGSDKRFLKLERTSLESFIKQRIQEGSCAGV